MTLPGQNGDLGSRRFKEAVSVALGGMYPVLSWKPQLPRVIYPLCLPQKLYAGLSGFLASPPVGLAL